MAPPSRGVCQLKTLLKSKGMTQTVLEEKTGISQRMISHYANDGKRMNIDAARAISTALGCRMEDLYKW
ncbi:MAG: helix-turn-helix domain-containing protein [Candidatus Pristimantibacillus sp.]